MVQEIKLKYFDPVHKVAFSNWKELWLVNSHEPVVLRPEVHKGALYYRCKGSCKRFSYMHIKKTIIKKETTIRVTWPHWFKL